MWQDTNNIVHIQNVNGQEVKQFPHFQTRGHIITMDKAFYLSADGWGKLYKGSVIILFLSILIRQLAQVSPILYLFMAIIFYLLMTRLQVEMIRLRK